MYLQTNTLGLKISVTYEFGFNIAIRPKRTQNTSRYKISFVPAKPTILFSWPSITHEQKPAENQVYSSFQQLLPTQTNEGYTVSVATAG